MVIREYILKVKYKIEFLMTVNYDGSLNLGRVNSYILFTYFR